MNSNIFKPREKHLKCPHFYPQYLLLYDINITNQLNGLYWTLLLKKKFFSQNVSLLSSFCVQVYFFHPSRRHHSSVNLLFLMGKHKRKNTLIRFLRENQISGYREIWNENRIHTQVNTLHRTGSINKQTSFSEYIGTSVQRRS